MSANAAYLAALNLMGPGGTASAQGPATGPQPVPLPSDGGPLGSSPSNARVLGYPNETLGDYGTHVPRT